MTTFLRPLWAISRSTWREVIRSRLLMTTVLFAVVMMGLSVAAASVSLGQQARLITDVGLAAQSAVGTIIAVALAISSFAGELTRRTAYPVLARPLSRATFVAGKFFGLWAAVSLVAVLMIAATAGVVALYGEHVAQPMWVSIPLALAEMAVAVSIGLLFSALSSPVLAASFAAGTLLAGNLVSDIQALANRMAAKGMAGAWLFKTLFYVLPDVEKMSVRVQAANDLVVPAAYWLDGILYGALYTVCALTAAAWVFTRRRSL